MLLLFTKLVYQLVQLSLDWLSIWLHGHGLIVDTEATLVRGSLGLQLPLDLEQFLLLRLHNLVELSNLDVHILLVFSQLWLHVHGIFGSLVKLIICLAKQVLHFFDLSSHALVFIFQQGETIHTLMCHGWQHLWESLRAWHQLALGLHSCECATESANIRLVKEC